MFFVSKVSCLVSWACMVWYGHQINKSNMQYNFLNTKLKYGVIIQNDVNGVMNSLDDIILSYTMNK